jgi:hypothetical protein
MVAGYHICAVDGAVLVTEKWRVFEARINEQEIVLGMILIYEF